MPSIAVYDKTGAEIEQINLSDEVFGITPHIPAMHLVVKSYLANQRRGTQSTLTRGEVSGGGKKPWRQKGTGRARQGSTRSPQWTHGGVALGPKPRDYVIDVNKKVRRLAIKSALSAKVADSEVKVLDTFGLEGIKTKEAAAVLDALEVGKKTLIVVPENDEYTYKSARNIAGVKVVPTNSVCVYDVLNANTLLLLKDSVAALEALYASASASETAEEEVA
ncbi:MAG: 50S ribosomal protein L4 [Oscillospiraceae bacterium]|jgi:large subunit ribosomal protein L4|nr:50S ribosomal protein L4 [Oscillospiraceae bacterium]